MIPLQEAKARCLPKCGLCPPNWGLFLLVGLQVSSLRTCQTFLSLALTLRKHGCLSPDLPASPKTRMEKLSYLRPFLPSKLKGFSQEQQQPTRARPRPPTALPQFLSSPYPHFSVSSKIFPRLPCGSCFLLVTFNCCPTSCKGALEDAVHKTPGKGSVK